jgi:hypothetical protein
VFLVHKLICENSNFEIKYKTKNCVFPIINLKLTQRQYLRTGPVFPAYLFNTAI